MPRISSCVNYRLLHSHSPSCPTLLLDGCPRVDIGFRTIRDQEVPRVDVFIDITSVSVYPLNQNLTIICL